MIDSPDLAQAAVEVFDSDCEPQNSWRVQLNEKGKMTWTSSDGVLKQQPTSSNWRRVSDLLYGLLPIDDQM